MQETAHRVHLVPLTSDFELKQAQMMLRQMGYTAIGRTVKVGDEIYHLSDRTIRGLKDRYTL